MLVRRAVTNVLVNALRHSEPRQPVEVRLSQDGGHVQVRITNRGRPIPSNLLAKVFERFVRVDSARDRSHGGAGLGLAIVASIMKLHDGRASAESDSLRGETTLTLAFPAAGPRRNAEARVLTMPSTAKPHATLKKFVCASRPETACIIEDSTPVKGPEPSTAQASSSSPP
jgi:K+-sensing histidine kinase KdpD